MAKWALILVALVACEPAKSNRSQPGSGACRSNAECSDGLFCNGAEICEPGVAGTDARGCAPATQGPCSRYQTCDEAADRCVSNAVDADGDGVASIATGGNDCDDTNAAIYPGNAETCDAVDNDCDPDTLASATKDDGDHDGDGVISSACSNGKGTKFRRGLDCDDSNPLIGPGSQICDGTTSVKYCPTAQDVAGYDAVRRKAYVTGTIWETRSCGTGGNGKDLHCYPQPNGLGVCAP